MRLLILALASSLVACGSNGDDAEPADSTSVSVAAPAPDTTIKTDTVKVAGDTAR